MKLAPHDADLVEADARHMFEQGRAEIGYPMPPWERVPEEVRDLYRRAAANPEAFAGRDPGRRLLGF